MSVSGMLNNSLLRNGLRIRHLRLAVALSESRNVSRAADLVGITQPAASRMLVELENSLGAPFCRRGPRGVTLTAMGEAFSNRARRILIELDNASDELALIAGGEMGIVRIGSVTAPSISLVTPLLEQISSEHSGFMAEVVVNTSDVLIRQLLDGMIDFALCRVPVHVEVEKFVSSNLHPEEISLVCRADHPLAGQTVTAADLVDERWVLEPKGNLLRHEIDQMFAANDLGSPKVLVATTSLLVHLALVVQSNAIAATASDVANLIAGGGTGQMGLQRIHLAPSLHITPYSLVRIRDRELPPPAQLAFDRLSAVCGLETAAK